jgi:hypothetical protein
VLQCRRRRRPSAQTRQQLQKIEHAARGEVQRLRSAVQRQHLLGQPCSPLLALSAAVTLLGLLAWAVPELLAWALLQPGYLAQAGHLWASALLSFVQLHTLPQQACSEQPAEGPIAQPRAGKPGKRSQGRSLLQGLQQSLLDLRSLRQAAEAKVRCMQQRHSSGEALMQQLLHALAWAMPAVAASAASAPASASACTAAAAAAAAEAALWEAALPWLPALCAAALLGAAIYTVMRASFGAGARGGKARGGRSAAALVLLAFLLVCLPRCQAAGGEAGSVQHPATGGTLLATGGMLLAAAAVGAAGAAGLQQGAGRGRGAGPAAAAPLGADQQQQQQQRQHKESDQQVGRQGRAAAPWLLSTALTGLAAVLRPPPPPL